MHIAPIEPGTTYDLRTAEPGDPEMTASALLKHRPRSSFSAWVGRMPAKRGKDIKPPPHEYAGAFVMTSPWATLTPRLMSTTGFLAYYDEYSQGEEHIDVKIMMVLGDSADESPYVPKMRITANPRR